MYDLVYIYSKLTW